MEVNTDKLLGFAKEEGISIQALAIAIGVDYSYLTRVLRKEKSGGINDVVNRQ